MFAVVVVVDYLLWKALQGSYFDRLVNTLSPSLWLTQAKPLGSRGSSSRRRHLVGCWSSIMVISRVKRETIVVFTIIG